MPDKDLLYEVVDHVATITINREAQRNSISPDALTLFHEYLDFAEADEAVRVVCITGAGERAFCSGADLAGGLGDDDDSQSLFDRYALLISRLAAFPKPTVARINGYCLAGGTGFPVNGLKRNAPVSTPRLSSAPPSIVRSASDAMRTDCTKASTVSRWAPVVISATSGCSGSPSPDRTMNRRRSACCWVISPSASRSARISSSLISRSPST